MKGSSSVAAGGRGGHGVPPGFMFKPTDEHLMLYYLTNYVSSLPSPIRIGNVYATEPWNPLDPDETVAYFLTPLRRKGSSKANHVAGSSSSRMEKKDNIYDGCGNAIARNGTFSFHAKKQSPSTGWVMHEYVLGCKEEDRVTSNEAGLCWIQRRTQAGEDKRLAAKRIKVTPWTPEDPSTSHRTTVLCAPDRPSIVVPPSSTWSPLEDNEQQCGGL